MSFGQLSSNSFNIVRLDHIVVYTDAFRYINVEAQPSPGRFLS